MRYKKEDHTFAVCAYKESRYLDECLRSLTAQSVRTRVIVVTSTPNPYIRQAAERYHAELFINQGEKGITQDWNFALRTAGTALVTIAHQDDVYDEKYVERMFETINGAKHPLIFFTDYGEIREGKKVLDNRLLRVKRLMLKPLERRSWQRSVFVRRRILSLGCPICCPAVTYAVENTGLEIFRAGFRSDEDWEAWEKLSRLSGEFLYRKEPLMFHRIHEESETSIILGDSARSREDYQMFCKFWPKWIAGGIARLYASSEKSNELENK